MKPDYYYEKPTIKSTKFSETIWELIFPFSKLLQDSAKEMYARTKGEGLTIHSSKQLQSELGLTVDQYYKIIRNLKNVGLIHKERRMYVRVKGVRLE